MYGLPGGVRGGAPLPASQVRTYRIAVPRESGTTIVPCADADCDAYAHGWITTVDRSTDLGKAQYHYLTSSQDRKYLLSEEGDLAHFRFDPGTRCFRTHTEKRGVFLLNDPSRDGVIRFGTPDNWRDDMGEHLEKIDESIEKRG